MSPPPPVRPLVVPRNFLRPCLLLLLAEHPSHGYDLLAAMAAMGVARPDPGGMYRTLRAMEHDGLVRSGWEPSTAGPARRSYQVSDAGREWLAHWVASVRDLRRVLDEFVDRFDAVTGEVPPA